MNKNNGGSALIITLLLMSFVIIIAISIIGTTQSELTMAKLNNDSNAAYYVAEAGIQRALHVIFNCNNGLQAEINNTSFLNEISNNYNITRNINNVLINYLYNHKFTSYISYYSDIRGGIDTLYFTRIYNKLSYYDVKVLPFDSGLGILNDDTYTVNLIFTSIGYIGTSKKTITAVYMLEYSKSPILYQIKCKSISIS